jgi:hypothetical protein
VHCSGLPAALCPPPHTHTPVQPSTYKRLRHRPWTVCQPAPPSAGPRLWCNASFTHPTPLAISPVSDFVLKTRCAAKCAEAGASPVLLRTNHVRHPSHLPIPPLLPFLRSPARSGSRHNISDPHFRHKSPSVRHAPSTQRRGLGVSILIARNAQRSRLKNPVPKPAPKNRCAADSNHARPVEYR